MDILFLLPYFFCALGVVILMTLSIIDLRVWLLPDWLNASFAACGLAFHTSLHFRLMEPVDLLYGALAGLGVLGLVRYCGNRYYKQETLGLGDVKLLGAAGVWLGVEGVVVALTFGAFAGLLHGIGVGAARAIKEKSALNLKRLMIPAGPGFCIGICAAFIWKYSDVLMP